MTGGIITRYHTPAMQGRGLKEDVISEVGPITIESSQKALSKEQDGKSLSEVGTHFKLQNYLSYWDFTFMVY